jgi:hypothetical protein
VVTVLSDAENLPKMIFPIFGPSQVPPLLDEPDLEPHADPVYARTYNTGDFAIVRVYNLGGAMATVSSLDISDDADAAFDIIPEVINQTEEIPSESCLTAACGDVLAGDCTPIYIGSGNYANVTVAVDDGDHVGTLSVTSNDVGNCPLDVGLESAE